MQSSKSTGERSVIMYYFILSSEIKVISITSEMISITSDSANIFCVAFFGLPLTFPFITFLFVNKTSSVGMHFLS